MGWLAGGSGWNTAVLAQVFGRIPKKLPEGKSVFELKGEVLVNGVPATYETVVGPADTVRTGPGGSFVGVVGQDALLLRENSELQMSGVAGTAAKRLFRLVTGAVLAVFGRRHDNEELEVASPTAIVGLRGTGVYAEARPDRTYFCTCYGTSRIVSAADPKITEMVSSIHHDAPKWILAQPERGKLIVPAPFQNHTDLELMTLEALVGREVPFVIPDSQYGQQRREY